MISNKTQLYILTHLLKTNGAKYTSMRPVEVENDLFYYHLKFLLDAGLIYKADGLYFLSEKGKKLVTDDVPIDAAGEIYNLFRVNTLSCVLKKVDGKLKILSQMRKCHPFYGNIGIIGGPVNKGFTIEESASHQVKKETGMDVQFKEAGLIRHLRYTSSGDLFSDHFHHVCVAVITEGEPEADNDFGVHFWSDIETAIKFEQHSSQGSLTLVEYLKKLSESEVEAIPYFHVQERKVVPVV